MTLRERAVAALELRQPDSVPTFELEFQLEEEMFGLTFDYAQLKPEVFTKRSALEQDHLLEQWALHHADLYMNKLEYSIMPTPYMFDEEHTLRAIRALRKVVGDRAMIHSHGDGTFSIPDGEHMCEFAYAIADDIDAVKAKAERMANAAIESNKRKVEAGIDCFILCADYCYNTNPFLSPPMFAELVTPYLYNITKAARDDGTYVIKHTDGNIMPILDQLVYTHPHAIHSLDPQAGVDIKVVKELVGDKVALCGNVNCALMQTGTDDEVIASAEYCMTYGKPNGGYLFCTSNVPFKGLPVERYRMILDVWRRMRAY